MASSQRTEDSAGPAGASGVPGTASTLPRPAGQTGAGSVQPRDAHDREHHLSNQPHGEEDAPAGRALCKKMSLAVLVDQDLTWEQEKNGFKRVLAPPTPEKLKVIHDLVAGITGFNAERGDQLVVETLPSKTR